MSDLLPARADLALATAAAPAAGRAAVDTLATPTIGLADITWQASDGAGVEWICEDLEGWADLPTSNAPATHRTFDHGAWSGPGWFGPRPLQLTGVVAAPDRYNLQLALHQLRGVVARSLEEAVPLTVNEMDGTKWLGVKAAAAQATVHYITAAAARVVVPLFAPWPVKRGMEARGSTAAYTRGGGRHYNRPSVDGEFRRYGPLGSTGTLFLDVAGNAPVRPQFLITGPSLNPTIIAAGQTRRLRFMIDLGHADQLGVDADTHTVVLNDVANRRYVLSADSAWFDLLAGHNAIQFRPDDLRGTLTVIYASGGWW